jgi:hypothetical protein
MVHPVPTPVSVNILNIRRINLGGINQNEKLFNRGNAISGQPNIIGNNQFPNPPINTGITKKKIIIRA